MTLMLLAALAVAAKTPAQDTIPLAPYGNGPLRKVAVVVAGDTLDFLFDTGGGVTIISPEIAARLGCTPAGRSHGYRMTGEHLEGPLCRDVPLEIAGFETRTEASVTDLMKLLGPNAPPVHGMISLRTFERRALTLDLPQQRLVVETPQSLARRAGSMQPIRARLATGLEGGQLDLYIGIPAGDAELWLLWDSGNQGPTFLAPWAARLLGVEAGGGRETDIALGAQRITIPVQVKDIIHDGVLNARLVARAAWAVDLADGRMWVSDVEPLLALPSATDRAVTPPAREAAGWYEVTLTVNGRPERALLHVDRAGAQLRFIGEERVFALRNVSATDERLDFVLPMGREYPVRIEFAGLRGRGTWGDAARGGAVEAVKVR